MRLSSRVLAFLLVLFVLVGISATTFAAIHTSATPKARVTARVDSSKRTTLYGHVPAAVRHGLDMGRVDPDTKVEHLIMVLKSDEDQKREVRRIIDEQQDKRTANYHQWVTPEEFGEHFGVHDSDIENIKAWLASEGLTVESVTKSKRTLRFSGTIGQLEHAFQTEMHHFSMPNGETHVSNSRDISVPAAFNRVIAGVPTLNDFFRKSHRVDGGRLSEVGRNSKMKLGPKYTSSSSVHYVSAADFATIYNTAPLLAQGVNGSGVTIGVVGRSDILLSDVQTYRQMMGLPPNDPNFIHAGEDQGTLPGDDGESDLDVEISGGAAPGATIDFVIGTPTFLVDGITNSTEYIVENNIADIMSISYGGCEADEGTAGNSFNSQLFEQGAAQGMSIFIASGDNGPAGCDDQSTQTYEVLGYAAPAEASTWYSVAVGGTEFYADGPSPTTYWSSTNNANLSSALSYIPEYPWNEAKSANPLPSGDSGSDLWSASGAVSAYYLRPPWQTGSGINGSSDPAINLANGTAGNWVASINITNAGSGYTTAPSVTFGTGCASAPAATSTITGGSVTGITFTGYSSHFQGFNCTSVPTVTFAAAPTGGTTATATAVLGPMQYPAPLISGVPHRLSPDVSLNAASGHDATFFCSEGVCELNSSGGLVDAGLVGGTSVAAPSMAGVQALINQVNGGRQGMPAYIYYTLANAQNPAACNSSTLPGSSSSCAFQDTTLGNTYICGISGSGCSTTATADKIGWAAGTGYDLATGLGSPNAANLASQWSSVVFNSSNTTLGLSQTSFQHGTSITLSGTVAPGSSSGTPTGDVAFIVSSGSIGDPVNQFGDGSLNGPVAFATLSGGAYSATLNNLPGGTYYVTARYGGDENFASSLSSGVQITVGQEGSGLTITPYALSGSACTITSASSFAYASDILINLNVAGNSGAGAATGTVTLNMDGNPIGTYTLDPNGNAFALSGSITSSSCIYDYSSANITTIPVGTHSLTASYSGDAANSASTAGPVSITVTQNTPTLTLTPAGGATIASGKSFNLTGTFGGLTPINGVSTLSSAPSGVVTFTDTTTSTVLGTAPIVSFPVFSGNNYTYQAFATLTTTGVTTSGANSITASFAGDTNWAPLTSAAVTFTVATGTSTTVAVTSSANPTTLGGRPTFTATVTTATAGAVAFYDGAYYLGAGSAVGTAHTSTLRIGTTTPFVGGTHNITAVYQGSGSTLGSVSPAFVETVTQGTTTINLAAKTNGTTSQNYTFAAVLTPSSTTAIYAPNQSVVNFFDGATNIGSAQPITITSGQGGYALWTATLTTSLSAGTHTITATYSDINYSLATSNAQTVTVGGNQTITFTTNAPSSAGTGSQFTVAAAASSGLAVAYTSFGSCTNSGATYTMTKGTGTCYVIANQAGNSSFGPAPEVTQTVAATIGNQTITFTTPPPASAVYGSNFTVAATASSGLAVAYTSAGACSNSGATYTMTSGTGTCSVIANQAGNVNYNPAPTATDSVNATLASQTIVLTGVPASAEYGASFTIGATGGASGQPVILTSSGACSNVGTTYSMTSGAGTCSVIADQAGNANYAAATEVNDPVSATPANPSVSVGSTPNPSTYATSVTFTATITSDTGLVKGRKGASKKPLDVTGTVTWSSNTGCSASTVSGYPGVATCTTSSATHLPVGTDVVTATYSGDSNHNGGTGSVNQVVQGGIATSINVTSVSPASEDFGADTPVTITAALTWVGNGVAPTASDVTISGNGNGTYGATSCAPRVHESITCTATYTPTPADTPASYTETATFAGDTNYSGSSSPQTNNFTINGSTSTTTVTSTPNPSVYATSVTFTATITGENGNVKGGARKNGAKPMNVTGTVTWSSNTGCSPSTVSGYPGVATCTTSAATHLPVGTDPVTATYSGDGNHAGSSGSVNQVVTGGIATSISVTNVSPASEDYGADTPVTITAVLSWTGHGTAPTASDVTIGGNGPSGYSATTCGARVGDTITCTATYSPTTADIPEAYTETAAFSGDTNYASSSSSQTNNFTINQATSSTSVTSNNNPSTYGQPVTFTATIGGENGNVKGGKAASRKPLVVTGTVTWSANTGCSTSTVSGYPGVATCTTSGLAAGTYAITATYSGDDNHSESSGSVSGGQVVNQASQTITFTTPAPPTAKSGDAFTVAATGGASGNPVTFTVGAGSACTVVGATYTMSSNTGNCYVVADQAGNSNYAAAAQVTETVTAVKKVTKIAPTVTFTGAPANAPYLSTFTLATTQNSGVTPTFSSTNRVICTVSGNVVTMIIGTGTCTVKATWATNDYYLGTSLTQSTTATKLNTTTAITGTATLTPSNHKKVTVYFGVTNGVNAVAGDVTVTASSGETCTGTVLAGKCAVTFAASGSKTLTAVYTGNPNNNASTSASYPLTVN